MTKFTEYPSLIYDNDHDDSDIDGPYNDTLIKNKIQV